MCEHWQLLAADPGAGRRARDVVRQRLSDYPEEVVLPASLLTSELVQNAVRHTQAESITLHVCAHPTVRVAVFDPGDGVPEVLEPGTGSETGRGLRLVDAMASRWGYQRTPEGKEVW